MLSPDNFEYAMEQSHVIREPDRRIDTFGSTNFSFEILTEDMDQAGKVKIRRGEVEAAKPSLIKPGHLSDVELEGFDPKVLRVIEHFREQGRDLSFLRYGFTFKRGKTTEETVTDSLEAVKQKALEEVRRTGDPSLAIIEGVDDSWEVAVMKFTLEMILKSQEINQFDFKRKGLIE